MNKKQRVVITKVSALLLAGLGVLFLPLRAHAVVTGYSGSTCPTTTILNQLSFPGDQGIFLTSFSTTSYLGENTPDLLVVDNRAASIDDYFADHQMPLAGYGKTFVEVADSCGMDWRLLPAIAIQESTGGKRMVRNNPFGWGSAKIGFDSLEAAIIVVGNNLCGNAPATKNYYKNKTTAQKLWSYNGSVSPSYIGQVMQLMKRF